MTPARTWSLSADWIIPADGPSIRQGIMRGSGGVIEAVGSPRQVAPVQRADNHRHLRGLAVLPGLINAHTHLELTHLRGQLPPRRPMTQWLFGVWSHHPTGKGADAAVADGAKGALATGTTTVGDICHNNRAWRTLKDSPIRKKCFAEVAGIGPAAPGAMPRLLESIEGVTTDQRLGFGIAPHAPYSTGEEVYSQAIALARRSNWPVATHLAETESERQFMLRGSGKFFELLSRLGMIDSSVPVHNCKPLEFAQRVGLLDGPCILAHCNFVDDQELKILAESEASVVYCPRSSDFFGHTGHRYAEMLDLGINVALATDSLASNSSLEMLAEMRRVRQDGKINDQTIVRMATLNGARALGMDEQVGTLAAGKQADWIAVQIPANTANPLEAILAGKGKVVETVIAGETVFSLL